MVDKVAVVAVVAGDLDHGVSSATDREAGHHSPPSSFHHKLPRTWEQKKIKLNTSTALVQPSALFTGRGGSPLEIAKSWVKW